MSDTNTTETTVRDDVYRIGVFPLIVPADVKVGAEIRYANAKGELKDVTVVVVGFPFELNGHKWQLAFDQGDLVKITNAVQRPDDLSAIFGAKSNGRK